MFFSTTTQRESRSTRLSDPNGPAFIASFGMWDSGWQIHPARLNGDGLTDFFLYNPGRGLWVQARTTTAATATFTYLFPNL